MTQLIGMARPLTPYFLFCEDMRKGGKTIPAKDMSKKWKKMKKDEKEKYLDEYNKAKSKYDKFVEEVYGVKPNEKEEKPKPSKYAPYKIRAITGQDEKILPMRNECYAALCKVMV